MEEPHRGLGIAPIDEDHKHARRKKNESARRTSLSRDAIPSSPSSSSAQAADAAMKIGSSISDLGQHLFHQVDRVSSRLVGDAVAYGFFSDEDQQSRQGSYDSHTSSLPPPSPFLAVATDYSTTTDEYDSDIDSDDDGDDDDKTVQMDNTTTSSRSRRIDRHTDDNRAIEQDKGSPTELPSRCGSNDMPSVSPSSLSSSPRYRNRRDVKKAQRALAADMAAASSAATNNNSNASSKTGLPRIPEDSGALMDESSVEDDGSVESSSMPVVVAVARGRTNTTTIASSAKDDDGSGERIDASYLAAYDPAVSGGDGCSSAGGGASAITIVHSLSSSIRGLMTSVLSVPMSNTSGGNGSTDAKEGGSADPPGILLAPSAAEDCNSSMLLQHRPRKDANDAESDALAHGMKRITKKCRLTKLRIAAILLCLFAIVLILAAVLRPDKSNLRGGSTSSISGTTDTTETDADTEDTTITNSAPPAPGALVTTGRPATATPTGAPTKAPTVWTSTGLPPLEYLGTFGTRKGLCQGDCDTDDDCLPHLVCHRRDGYDRVPGCDAMPGTKDVDYCALPGETHYPTVAPVATAFPTQTPTQNPTKKQKEVVVEKETKDDTSFSFYVMSNGPYSSGEEEILATQLMDSTDGLFSVHLGDIFTAKKKDCDEETYQHAADLLRKSKLPMFVLPGDEDWMDCDNIKPKKAFDLWSETYLRFEDNWQRMNEIPELVERSTERQENFAFLFRDVLFIGINNSGGQERAIDIDKDEYKQRGKDVRAWVKLQVKAYEDGPLRAVVMFAHAYRFKDTFQWISERLQEKGVQIFLLHGDGGVFDLSKPLTDNFYQIGLDAVGRAPPIHVTVFDEPLKNIFDRKDTIFVGDSLAINRQGGEY